MNKVASFLCRSFFLCSLVASSYGTAYIEDWNIEERYLWYLQNENGEVISNGEGVRGFAIPSAIYKAEETNWTLFTLTSEDWDNASSYIANGPAFQVAMPVLGAVIYGIEKDVRGSLKSFFIETCDFDEELGFCTFEILDFKSGLTLRELEEIFNSKAQVADHPLLQGYVDAPYDGGIARFWIDVYGTVYLLNSNGQSDEVTEYFFRSFDLFLAP